MKVSVILCTYSTDMYPHFRETVESVRSQTFENTELVVVVDGNEALNHQVKKEFLDNDRTKLHQNEKNRGLLESRNTGAELATGDIVAFIDDDAIAADTWIEELVQTYESTKAIAVGGKMTPEWTAGKPAYLPEEFYFLVGVTHKGFPEEQTEVRNTFGSNISFRRDVFLELGGFNTRIGGREGDKNLQGGETEFCARMLTEYGQGVIYNPDAKVAHKIFEYRTKPKWLLDRAFWQGYSKRAMEIIIPESSNEECEFLKRLFTEFIPGRIVRLLKRPSISRVVQLVMLIALTTAVGIGYLYGIMKWR